MKRVTVVDVEDQKVSLMRRSAIWNDVENAGCKDLPVIVGEIKY